MPREPHIPLLASAEARAELADAVLAAADAPAAARLTLSWMGRHAGVERTVCLLTHDEEKRLVGVAGDGVASARVAALSLDLGDGDNPLVMALGGGEPVLFGRGRARGRARAAPDTPLDDETFWSIPLRRPEMSPQEPALGLLLLGGLDEEEPNADVRWAATILSARLLCARYGQARGAERKLMRERGLLYGILDAVTDPILLTDGEGRMLIANSHAEALFTAPQEASEGLRRAVTLNNMLFSASLFTAAEQGTGRRELLLVDPRAGEDLLFELISTTLDDRRTGADVVSVLRNVNDLRRATEEIEENYRRLRMAEAEVRAERDRLDLILDSVADPILVTDTHGNIVRMNPPAERLFTAPGGSTDEAERRVRSNDAVFTSSVTNLFAGQALRWRGELELTDPRTGTSLPFEALAGKVVSKHGADTAVVTILHDRSEAEEKARLYEQVMRHSLELKERVREATAELVSQNEVLQRQKLALEQASHLKSQFLANMSHELRTPLNAILGYTHLLLQGISGPLAPRQHEKLQRVDSNARHLLSIINDLLDIARIEAGKMPVHSERFALGDLVDEVLSEMEPVIARTRLKVTAEVPRALPQVRSDRQKVKQVLMNLLSNALKFTPEGFVRVQAAHDVPSDALAISVADTGIGISADQQRTIFEDFHQADDSFTRQYGGTGLGLSICRRLAHTLGGRISLVSSPGVGSTFTLHVPRRLKARRR
ncbi:MAG: ATP-binding protein [Planctomycetes bacterium]|nr:ATP-binding protein [Planctomycetota bacterium]